jgi:hypothetical protein
LPLLLPLSPEPAEGAALAALALARRADVADVVAVVAVAVAETDAARAPPSSAAGDAYAGYRITRSSPLG